MAQQTAVEWMVQEINKLTGLNIAMDEPCIEQAKQMEKEQMFEFTKKHYIIGEHSMKFHTEEFEQYYNETYGKE